MIYTDEQLVQAQEAVANLQRVLLEARKVHPPREYRALSEPILLEIQRRELEILAYLGKTEAELTAA